MQDDCPSDTRGQARPSFYSKFYQQRVKIFYSLFQLLEKSEDSDTLTNTQYIIETLIAKIDQTIDGSKLLDDVVLRKENIRILFNCLKSNLRYRRKAAAEILNLMFSLLLNESVEEPEKRNTMMASNNQASPEFQRAFEQRRTDEKNSLFQTFVDELDDVLSGISSRRSSERTFNNSIGKEVKIVDNSDIKILQLIQASLKFNLENINLTVSLSKYIDVFFEIFKTSPFNSSVHTLFSELITICLAMMNKSPHMARNVILF